MSGVRSDRDPDSNAADPVTDALVHGLLHALARREGRAAGPAPRRRRWPRFAAAATALAAACLMVAVWLAPPAATAESVLVRALEAARQSGIRVYDVRLLPVEDEPRGMGGFDGRLVLEGGPEGRLVLSLSIGPAAWPARFGIDGSGPWFETPFGATRDGRDAPLLARVLEELDDRLLRIETILDRCREGYEIAFTPEPDASWRLRARRTTEPGDAPVEAEFLVRERDGAVTEARILLEGPLGGRSTLQFTLREDLPAAAGDLEAPTAVDAVSP